MKVVSVAYHVSTLDVNTTSAKAAAIIRVFADGSSPYALVAAVSLDGRSLKDVKVIPTSLSQHGQLGQRQASGVDSERPKEHQFGEQEVQVAERREGVD